MATMVRLPPGHTAFAPLLWDWDYGALDRHVSDIGIRMECHATGGAVFITKADAETLLLRLQVAIDGINNRLAMLSERDTQNDR